MNNGARATVGFQTSSRAYFDNMIGLLRDDLQKYQREGNIKWAVRTQTKLEYYMQNRPKR